jgi:hypothetical protein
MNKLIFGCAAFLAAICISNAECGIGTIWQPLSLLGTEGEGKPLPDEPEMAVTIESRPTYTSGAHFESVVASLALPHQIAGAPESFPRESNLVVLLKTSINGIYRQDGTKEITLDLSNVPKEILKQHGITLKQYSKLLIVCLTKNLRQNSLWSEQGSFDLVWKLPSDSGSLVMNLPKRLGSKL